MHQGIIAALKRNYKSKMLHAMVKNLERYDELRAVGESLPAGVRGLNHAYPPNLTSPSSSTEMVSPEDSLDSEDDEVQPLTRMEALNSVNITEGTEMVRKVLQMMAVLGEDDTSHMLTTVYHKCLDLKIEKRRLNTKQTVLRDFFVSN